MKDFAINLKKLRTEHNLTQEELASKLKISRSTLGMYETGKREPDFETLEVIADFFNVDMNFLLGKTVSENDEFYKSKPQYYLDNETAAIAQEIFENPDMKSLFDMSRKMSPEKLKAHLQLMKMLFDAENGSED